jgi:hypothetical protein
MLENIERLWAAAQKVREIAEKAKQADMKLAVADLVNTVADLKTERAQQQEQIAELRRQLREVQERLAIKQKVAFRDGFYHLAQPEPGISAGPFCPLCYEKESSLITLRHTRTLDTATRAYHLSPHFYCPSCKQKFHVHAE